MMTAVAAVGDRASGGSSVVGRETIPTLIVQQKFWQEEELWDEFLDISGRLEG